MIHRKVSPASLGSLCSQSAQRFLNSKKAKNGSKRQRFPRFGAMTILRRMSPLPIALVVLSALAHATWNFLTKRAHASQAFMALATLAEVVVFLPVFVAIGIPSPLPPAELWWMFAI